MQSCMHKGFIATDQRVARLMRELELVAKRPRHRTVTTKSEQGASVAANLLQQDFHADQPNQKWTSDTTYIWTQEGWLYLAVVLDLFSRMVVGWAMAAVQDTTLVVHALRDGSGSSLSPSRVTAPLGSWQHLHFRKLCRTCPAQ
jgi:transposase InsO family protein